jgi:hypothetical protein
MTEDNSDLLKAENVLNDATVKLSETLQGLDDFKSASEALEASNQTIIDIAQAVTAATEAVQQAAATLQHESVERFSRQLDEGLRKVRTTNIFIVITLALLVTGIGIDVYFSWAGLSLASQ